MDIEATVQLDENIIGTGDCFGEFKLWSANVKKPIFSENLGSNITSMVRLTSNLFGVAHSGDARITFYETPEDKNKLTKRKLEGVNKIYDYELNHNTKIDCRNGFINQMSYNSNENIVALA